MKGKRLLILGAAFALGLSACANSAIMVKENPLKAAQGTAYKEVKFGANYNSGKISDYTSTWTSSNNGFTVQLTNFNNNNNDWNYVKCGRKNNASVATIVTPDAVSKEICEIEITIDAITASKVNSIKLYTSSNSTSWTEAGSYNKATGTQGVQLASSSANLYYKLEFDCASGSSNGLVTISNLKYYYNATGPVQLESPVPQYDDSNNVVTWDSVANASSYKVSVNNESNYVSATSPFNGHFQPDTQYTVYVKAIGDGNSYSDSSAASITFTAVAPFVGTDFVLCTSASDLVVGANYIITSGVEGTVKAMSTTSNTNNRRETEVSVNATTSKITSSSTVLVLTLGGSNGAWTFLTTNYLGTDGYLESTTSANNYLLVNAHDSVNDIPNNGKFAISFSGNVATIKANAGSRTYMRHNTSSSLFALYETNSGSGQTDVYLWKDANAGTAPVFGELDHINISTPASKTSFYVGETFSSAGLVLKGYDNYDESVALTEVYNSGFTTDFDGKVFGSEDVEEGKTVTVTYNGKTTFYYINVNAPIEKTVAEALVIAGDLENNETTDDVYSIEGYITNVEYTWTANNGITYLLADLPDSETTIKVFKSTVAGGQSVGLLLKTGDKVNVVGCLTKYNGTSEVAQGCVTTLVEAAPAEKINVSRALEIANALENDVKSDKEYQVDGYIVSIVTAWSTQYSNISYNLGDTVGSSTVIEVFRSSAANANEGPNFKVGDKVNVVGYLTKHADNPEFAQGCVTTLLEAGDDIDGYIGSFSSFKKLNAKENGPETITFGDLGLQNAVQYTDPFETDNYSVTFGGGANDGKYYTDGAAIRTYGNGTITIASNGSNIKSITLVWTGGASCKPASADVVSEGTYNTSTGVWTGDAESITFTRPSGSGHWRLQSLTISSGSVTVDSVSVEYGAKVSKTSWNALAEEYEVSEFGIMLFKTRQDSVPTVEEVFNATPAKTVAINNTQYGVTLDEDGDNYSFSVKVNISSEANYDIFFCAAPYVVVDGDYYFLDNMKYSVQSLASYYLNHSGSGLSADALNVLAGN